MKTESPYGLHTWFAVFFLTLAVVLGVGCGSKEGGGDVVATVDGRKIYRADVDK